MGFSLWGKLTNVRLAMGRRARIPSLKAQMALENVSKGINQCVLKENQQLKAAMEKGVNTSPDSNVTVTPSSAGAKGTLSATGTAVPIASSSTIVEAVVEEKKINKKQDDMAKTLSRWSGIVQATSGSGKNSSSSSGKKKWADKVEEELDVPSSKRSVWDNDTTKISRARFKLEYIVPEIHGEASTTQIELEDITSEIGYWKTVVICYVLGAHPPFPVIQGFIQRLLKKHGINKIVMLKNGFILVRFETMEGKNEVLQGNIFHFDNKPFMVKAWKPEMEFTKEENTERKVGLIFARLLVEVGMDTKLPDSIMFRNEWGNLIEQKKAKADTKPQDAQPVEQDRPQRVMQKGERHEQIKDSTAIPGERHAITLVGRERNTGSQGIQKFQGQQIKQVQEHTKVLNGSLL
ncbi:hypothetical protein H5410_045842 [Solanum commersonii]|uniref:DUF4283 domain-containing protein n=1 Tax=Solanum commersonii TaxID=4109 RepID=A0A9J5XEU4_SOLCO|nr:hypothetical protein H5410_045842 [Solanum commersonii]